VLAAVHLVLSAIPLAHPTDFPHQEPVPLDQTTDGGPATLVILLGVAFTLLTLAALIYLKQKMDAGQDDDPERSE
jgi:hypothetical protein